MSVVNRMLQDLEARRDEAATPIERERIYHDLRATPRRRTAARSAVLLVVFAVVVSAVIGGWWLYRDRFDVSVGMSVDVRKPGSLAQVKTSEPPEMIATATSPEPEKTNGIKDSAPSTKPVAAVAPAAPAPAESPKPAAVKPVAPKPATKKVSVAAPTRPAAPAKRPATKAAAPMVGGARSAIEKTAKPLTPAERAEKEFAHASTLIRDGRAQEAESHLVAALAADATHVPAREILVGLKLRAGNVAGAQELLETGIARVPGHYAFVQILARLLVDQGKDSEALAVLERSRARFAASPDYLAFHATLLQRVGRHAEATQAYHQVLGMRPTDGRLWIGLAISLEAQRDIDGARKALERARATNTLDRSLQEYVDNRLRAMQ